MKTVLIVYAHPEPRSLNRQLVEDAAEVLAAQGHTVLRSDLYGMSWKAVYDAADFPVRDNPERLSFLHESGHAYAHHHQPDDIVAEQAKLVAADAVIFQFPLWWFSMPAIMKGWIERVFAYGLAYGYRNEGNRYRYGEGGLAGKRAMLSVTCGGSPLDFTPRGINGPIEQLLFPITHGTLFFPGMAVLPTHALYGVHRLTPEEIAAAKAAWRQRVARLFDATPIAFRPQNAGDYPDSHVLAPHVAPGQAGIDAHIASPDARAPR